MLIKNVIRGEVGRQNIYANRIKMLQILQDVLIIRLELHAKHLL